MSRWFYFLFSALISLSLFQSFGQSLDYQWTASLGSGHSGSSETISAVAVDSSGNSYSVGWFQGQVDFDPGPDTFYMYGGATTPDMFIRKLDHQGNLIWCYSFGYWASVDKVHDIVIVEEQWIFVVGEFGGYVDFDPGSGNSNHSTSNPLGGDLDHFIAKYDVNGNYQWCYSAGNQWHSGCTRISATSSGTLFITGYYHDTLHFSPNTPWDTKERTGWGAAFIIKMSAGAPLGPDEVWTFTPPTSTFNFSGIATDDNAYVYAIAGFSHPMDVDPGPGVTNVSPSGIADYLLLQITPWGSLGWAHTFGSSGGGHSTRPNDIDVDDSGNVIVTGSYWSPVDFDPGPDTLNLFGSGCPNWFVHKLSKWGDLIWAREIWDYSGPGPSGREVEIGPQNEIFVLGQFPDWMRTSLPSQHNSNGLNDIGVTHFGSNGSIVDAFRIGGIQNDKPSDVSYSNGNLYITGSYGDVVDFNPRNELELIQSQSNSDAFLSKYSLCNQEYVLLQHTACDSFTWLDGQTYYDSDTTSSWIVHNSQACDTVVSMDLRIVQSIHTYDSVLSCDSVLWIDGQVYRADTDTPIANFSGINGCDSIVHLVLSIAHSKYDTVSLTPCDSLTWIDSNVYKSDTFVSYTLHTIHNCDSNVFANMMFQYSIHEYDSISSCTQFTWIDGTTYYSSTNQPIWVTSSLNGCDSIIHLVLSIQHSTHDTIVIESCDSFIWTNGTVYTSDLDSTLFFINQYGCDSVLSLEININNSKLDTQRVEACDSFTWLNGMVYTNDVDTEFVVFPTINNCDSVVFLNLKVETIQNEVVANSNVLHTNAVNVDYQWLNCDYNYYVIPGAEQASYTASNNGNFAVVVTGKSCIDTSECITVKSLGVGNSYGRLDVKVVNYGDGSYNIIFDRRLPELTILIYDSKGVLIRREMHRDTHHLPLKLAGPRGVYLLVIRNEFGYQWIGRVVKVTN